MSVCVTVTKELLLYFLLLLPFINWNEINYLECFKILTIVWPNMN